MRFATVSSVETRHPLFSFLDSVLGPQLVEMTKAIAVSGPAPVRELEMTFAGEVGPEELVEEVLDPFKKNCQLYRLLW